MVALFDCKIPPLCASAATDVLVSGRLAMGPQTRALEKEFADHLGVANVVAISNMTEALELALRESGVGPGDDVLTLAFNCLSSTSAIARVGATPRWVDIDPATGTTDPKRLAAACTDKTKALMLYSIAGYTGDVQAIKTFCDAHDIVLIEDANTAYGAQSNEAAVGTLGAYAVFSMYATRQLNCGEGALLVCQSAHDAAQIKKLRRYGIDEVNFRTAKGEINPLSDVPVAGFSAMLPDANAAVARETLKYLKSRTDANFENALKISKIIEDAPRIKSVVWNAGMRPGFWTYLVLSDNRDALREHLKSHGIGCSQLHQDNRVYSCFGNQVVDLPGTEMFSEKMLALPCGWWLTDSDISKLGTCISAF